jgi:hypothetical protein
MADYDVVINTKKEDPEFAKLGHRLANARSMACTHECMQHALSTLQTLRSRGPVWYVPKLFCRWNKDNEHNPKWSREKLIEELDRMISTYL